MLSLPLIVPRNDLTAWLQPSRRDAAQPNDAPDAPPDSPHASNANGNRRAGNRAGPSALSQLVADENAIEQRKQNVRRFGAGWLRPPGVAKTYQATMDEIAEREEQMMLERRDQQMRDLANAQEMEARRQQAEEAGEAADANVQEAEGERDLDDEVPEAEEVTFNEESLLEGSLVAGEENEGVNLDPDAEVDVERMLDMEEAEMSGMLEEERDLDDDVPEGGSYQHTDTEVEEESSDAEESTDASPGRSAGRAVQATAGDGESQLLSSSFLSSSPAARRGMARGNSFRERLTQARRQ